MTHTAKRNSDPNLEHPEGAGVCRPIVDLAQGAIRALNGPIWGTCHEVRGRMSIGRSGEADLTILDSAVSRQHALLVADMQGRVVLVDNDSANGVIVGDHRVWCHILSPGDEFSIGNSTFVFEAPGRVDAPWEADSATVAGDDLVSLIARYRAL
nr:FHA domain-containing protein [Deltaproteobacteria bacterium]